jgi:hypothetical protein
LILNGPVTSGGEIELQSGSADIQAQALTAGGSISVESLSGDVILYGPAESGDEITLEAPEGEIMAQALTATSKIVAKSRSDLTLNSPAMSGSSIDLQSNVVRSQADLILGDQVTSGNRISLESTEGRIVFDDSPAGLTPIINHGGEVQLSAREIHGNNEDSALAIQGASALILTDTGRGPIKLAEVGGSTIGFTDISVGDIGYGTIEITYDDGRGWIDQGRQPAYFILIHCRQGRHQGRLHIRKFDCAGKLPGQSRSTEAGCDKRPHWNPIIRRLDFEWPSHLERLDWAGKHRWEYPSKSTANHFR